MWTFALTLLFLVLVGFVFPAPVPVLVNGAILGALQGLIAIGIVLIYRANRVINFAAGDIGAVAGVLMASLIVADDWPFWPALLAGLAAAVLVGATVEFLIIRRFASAPRLILTVATIGVSVLLAGAQLGVPRVFGFDRMPQALPGPFPFSFDWFPMVFRGSHLLVLLVVPSTVLGLGVFLRRTRTGLAIRAVAESSDRALLLGIPVKRVGTVVWMIAAGLAGLASVMSAPIVGIPLGVPLGPALMARALAAAVIGRMENLTVTFGAAVALGVVEQAVFYDQQRSVIVEPVLFGLVMLALLVQTRGGLSRAEAGGQSSWTSVREVRPTAPVLMSLRSVRIGTRVTAWGPVLLALLPPLLLGPGNTNKASAALITAVLALSLLLLTGWAGQISLGQWAFAGFGGAVAGTLLIDGWNVLLALPVAGLVGAAVSSLIGIPALRLRGLFFAVGTFMFALASAGYFLNSEFFGYVPTERITRPILFGKIDLESEHVFYCFTLTVLVLVALSLRSLRASRTGRVLLALRENDRAAQSFGIDATRSKLVAFAFSGFLAGTAGGLLVLHQHVMLTSQLKVENSLELFSIVVIGGLSSVSGVLVATAVFEAIDLLIPLPALRLVANSVGLLLVLLLYPRGIGGWISDARDALLRALAVRRGLHVPSLVEDVRRDADAASAREQPA